MLRLPVIAAALLAALCSPRSHAAAEVDLSMDLDFVVRSAIEQPNGRLWFSGYMLTSPNLKVRSARLLPDGRVDPGYLERATPFGPDDRTFGGFSALQPDGKVVLTGSQPVPATGAAVNVVRVEIDGSLDSGFGSGGVAALGDVEGGQAAVAIQPDGRALVGVHVVAPQQMLPAVARLTPNGALDASYGTSGFARLPHPGYSLTRKILALSNGHAVVVGENGVCPGQSCVGVIQRLRAEGSPDLTFNGSGAVILPLIQLTDAVAFPDGRILVAGTRWSQPNVARGALVMLNADGTLHNAFGSGGSVLTHNWDRLGGIAVEPGGDIVGVGDALSLLRWNPDGSPQGRVTPIAPATGRGFAIVRQGDGRLLLAGERQIPGASPLLPGASRIVRFGTGSADMSTGTRLFSAQQYRDFLGREGDSAGIGHWAQQLDASALTRAQLVQAFLDSPEFQGQLAPIARLYLAFFLRAPDYDGLQFWVNASRAGMTLGQIAQEFALGAEFQGRYGSLDHMSFVRLVYNNVLGREADPDGLVYWTGLLISQVMTRGQLMLAFSESQEFQNTSRAEVFVTMVYAGMLRRAADAGGWAFWVGQMEAGASALGLIQGFLDAPEYRNRFVP